MIRSREVPAEFLRFVTESLDLIRVVSRSAVDRVRTPLQEVRVLDPAGDLLEGFCGTGTGRLM